MIGKLTLIEVQDNIGWVKINREKKLNALNRELIDELHERMAALARMAKTQKYENILKLK